MNFNDNISSSGMFKIYYAIYWINNLITKIV